MLMSEPKMRKRETLSQTTKEGGGKKAQRDQTMCHPESPLQKSSRFAGKGHYIKLGKLGNRACWKGEPGKSPFGGGVPPSGGTFGGSVPWGGRGIRCNLGILKKVVRKGSKRGTTIKKGNSLGINTFVYFRVQSDFPLTGRRGGNRVYALKEEKKRRRGKQRLHSWKGRNGLHYLSSSRRSGTEICRT